MVFEDVGDQLYNNKSDVDFLDTKIRCKKKYHEAGVEVLNPIIKKLNALKDGRENFQLLSLAPKSQGCMKLMKVFNMSERNARNAKKLFQSMEFLHFLIQKQEEH